MDWMNMQWLLVAYFSVMAAGLVTALLAAWAVLRH